MATPAAADPVRLPTGSWMDQDVLEYETISCRSEEDDALIAAVPELAGCAADGPSPQMALERAQIAAREWIETARELGRPVPGPKGRPVFA